jgi:hypothetical protein
VEESSRVVKATDGFRVGVNRDWVVTVGDRETGKDRGTVKLHS